MQDVIIVGAGPAGIGFLSSLYRRIGSEPQRSIKISMLDTLPMASCGAIADFDIPSDTRASKFLTCLDGLPTSMTSSKEVYDLTKHLLSYGENAAPLHLVGQFYRVLGQRICEEMTSKGQLSLHHNTEVKSARWCDTHWQIETGDIHFKAKSIVLACGASEVRTRFFDFLKDQNLTIDDLKAWHLSSEVLKKSPDQSWLNKLKTSHNPKVSIIGGSHSAISVAAKLLTQDIPFQEGGIRIFHRSPMHVTFESAEEARACGFHNFDANDLCPNTHRVFALKGFRLDSRNLLMSVKGYGDSPSEKRVDLIDLKAVQTATVKTELQDADLVISALGYSPDYIPLFSESLNRNYKLNAPNFVDKKSRLLNSSLSPIPHCYALGLASNYNLAGRFGEPSFTGQANGLVLWHKDIGAEIASQILRGC